MNSNLKDKINVKVTSIKLKGELNLPKTFSWRNEKLVAMIIFKEVFEFQNGQDYEWISLENYNNSDKNNFSSKTFYKKYSPRVIDKIKLLVKMNL